MGRGLRISVLRWPGGNFVSGYRWQDGSGPVDRRPRRLELACHAEESNRFGTDEFVQYCRNLGAEPYICINMGADPDAANSFEEPNPVSIQERHLDVAGSMFDYPFAAHSITVLRLRLDEGPARAAG